MRRADVRRAGWCLRRCVGAGAHDACCGSVGGNARRLVEAYPGVGNTRVPDPVGLVLAARLAGARLVITGAAGGHAAGIAADVAVAVGAVALCRRAFAERCRRVRARVVYVNRGLVVRHVRGGVEHVVPVVCHKP